MRKQRIIRSVPVIVTAAMLGVALWGIDHICSQGMGPLVAHLLDRTVTGSSGEAARAAQALTALGEDGLAPLVETLGNPRPSMAGAASNALFDRIEAWHNGVDGSNPFTQEQIACEATVVASALAARIDDFDPETQRTASKLALRLLALATRLPDAGEGRLVACCDHVLEVAGMPQVTRVNHSGIRTAGPRSDVARFASLSGGGLALDRSDPSWQRPGRRRSTNRVAASPSPSGSLTSPSSTPAAPSSRGTLPGFRPGPNDDAFHGKWRAWSAHASGSAQASRPAGNPQSIPRPILHAALAEMENFSLRKVMERLHDENPTIAAAAVEELAFRGFSEIEVALAQQLTSPDANVRRKLVDALPRAPGVDGRPWLFWLAVDSDANVRFAALAVLATATDPKTQRRVLELASRDRDRRIAALAKQLGGK